MIIRGDLIWFKIGLIYWYDKQLRYYLNVVLATHQRRKLFQTQPNSTNLVTGVWAEAVAAPKKDLISNGTTDGEHQEGPQPQTRLNAHKSQTHVEWVPSQIGVLIYFFIIIFSFALFSCL